MLTAMFLYSFRS